MSKITDPVTKRVEMINGRFDLPQETIQAMNDIRQAVDQCARSIQTATSKVETDTGRLIATMDLLQQAKNVACDSIILPHATK